MNTYETDAYNCHISIMQLERDWFSVQISYKVYNDLGTWVATPVYANVGNGEEMYLFTLATIANATKHNTQRITLDLPMLEAV